MLDEQKLTCRRCGFTEFVPADKRKRKDELCADCRRKPAKTINYSDDKSVKPCKPWNGSFDAQDNPVDAGRLFMPGKRVCGHRDCIEVTHILV